MVFTFSPGGSRLLHQELEDLPDHHLPLLPPPLPLLEGSSRVPQVAHHHWQPQEGLRDHTQDGQGERSCTRTGKAASFD